MTTVVEIADPSQVSVARRAAADLAKACGFDDTHTGRIALIATELGTNIVKHANHGEILVGTYADSSGNGIELIALDKGAGIADLGRAFEDGMSTAGSSGTGLGAIRRQSDQLNVFSRPDLGTVIASRISDGAQPAVAGAAALGAIALPFPGERVCGDDWTFAVSRKGPMVVVADGSGHGPAAAKAAKTAVGTFRDRDADDCAAILADMHRALAPTRGAAVAMVRFEPDNQVARFAGIGNIAGAIVAPDGATRRMVSHNGTVGHIAPRIREFSYPCPAGSLILLHSDGVSGKWDLAAYPGLAASHPSLVAGILFRDFRRKNDDATVVALRV